MEDKVLEHFTATGVSSVKIGFERDTFVFNYPGTSSAFFVEFKNYYGPTMNAFDAAEKSGRAVDLQKELEDLFESRNQSADKRRTLIPATFLRVTVTV